MVGGADGVVYTTGFVDSGLSCTGNTRGGRYVARYRFPAATPDWVSCFDLPSPFFVVTAAATSSGQILLGLDQSSSGDHQGQAWLLQFDPVQRQPTAAIAVGFDDSYYFRAIAERDDGSILVAGDGWISLVSPDLTSVLWTRARPEQNPHLAPTSGGRFYLSGADGALSLLDADGQTVIWSRTLASSGGWMLQPDSLGGIWVAGDTESRKLATTSDALQARHAGSALYRYDFGQWHGDLLGLDVENVGTIVAHPDNRPVYFAAASDGVYRSETNGWTWSKRSAGLPSGKVGALAISRDGLWAIADHALYRSVDEALTWTLQTTALPTNYPGKLVVDSGRLFLGGDGLWRSDDGGLTWRRLSDRVVVDVAASGPRVLVAGAHIAFSDPPDQLFVLGCGFLSASRDGGATWADTAAMLLAPCQVKLDPYRDGVAWALAGSSGFTVFPGAASSPPFLSGLLRSNDGGATWTSISRDSSLERLAFQPDDPGSLFGQDAHGGVLRVNIETGTASQVAGQQGAPQYSNAFAIGDRAVPLAGGFAGSDLMVRHYSAGGDLLYSTWLGGAYMESAAGIVADPQGGIMVAGATQVAGWPGYEDRPALEYRPFLARFGAGRPNVTILDPSFALGLAWATPYGWWLRTENSIKLVWMVP